MKGYYSDDYRSRAYSRNDYAAEKSMGYDLDCGCGNVENAKAHKVAAMVFIDFQTDINKADVYDCDTALKRGTLFVGLDKPLELRAKGGSCSCKTTNVNY